MFQGFKQEELPISAGPLGFTLSGLTQDWHGAAVAPSWHVAFAGTGVTLDSKDARRGLQLVEEESRQEPSPQDQELEDA